MKLSDVIKVWDLLHVHDTGELGFSNLEKAIDEIVGVENDCGSVQPQKVEHDELFLMYMLVKSLFSYLMFYNSDNTDFQILMGKLDELDVIMRQNRKKPLLGEDFVQHG